MTVSHACWHNWHSYKLSSLQVLTCSSISPSVTNSTIHQWHLRLGHASEKFCHLIFVRNLNNFTKFVPFNYLNCQLAKQLALSFSLLNSICDQPFDLIHFDIWGLAPTTTVNCYRYLFFSLMITLVLSGYVSLKAVLPYLKFILIWLIWFKFNSPIPLKFFKHIMP